MYRAAILQYFFNFLYFQPKIIILTIYVPLQPLFVKVITQTKGNEMLPGFSVENPPKSRQGLWA